MTDLSVKIMMMYMTDAIVGMNQCLEVQLVH